MFFDTTSNISAYKYPFFMSICKGSNLKQRLKDPFCEDALIYKNKMNNFFLFQFLTVMFTLIIGYSR